MAWIASLSPARAGFLIAAFLLLGTRAGYAELPDQDYSGTDDASTTSAASDSATTSSTDRDDPHWVMDERTQCWAYNSHAGANDTVSWSGGCSGDEISGPGTLTFFNDGKMAERISGNFGNGLLEDGHVTIAWANGTYYDGAEEHGRFNGQGLLIEPSGARYDGTWQDDVFKGPRLHAIAASDHVTSTADGVTPPTPPVSAAVSPAAAATGAAVAEVTNTAAPKNSDTAAADPDPQDNDAAPAKTDWAFLGNFFDANLVSVDGSTLSLAHREDGSITRSIHRPDGMAQTAVFSFMNGKLGTVRDEENGNDLIATFRMTDGAMTIDYADGRTETLAKSPDGGLMIAYDVPGSALYQIVWYPTGHVFTHQDREAALMQYADRLDVSHAQDAVAHVPQDVVEHAPQDAVAHVPQVATGAHRLHAAAKGHGGLLAIRLAKAETPMPEAPLIAPLPRPTPPPDLSLRDKPQTEAMAANDTSPITIVPAPVTHALHSTSLMPSTATRLAALSAPPIIVQTSQVHPIDGPTPKRSASDCLTVESDGTHWGFRNHCAADVQFAYCELNGSDNLTACDRGSVPGSVAAHGFGALVADTSIKDSNASHSFRWVACIGGAGEVMARLDRPDPPSGHCVFAGDVPDQQQQRADAGAAGAHAAAH